MESNPSAMETENKVSNMQSMPAGSGGALIKLGGLLSPRLLLRYLSPLSGDSCRVLCVSAPRSGKSLLTRGLAQQLPNVPRLIIDSGYDVKTPGFYVAESLPAVEDTIRAGHVPVVRENWRPVLDLAWNNGNCFLIIDEAAECGGRSGAVSPVLYRILRRGSHRNISVVLSTQRRTDVDADVQGLCSDVIIGILPGEADQRWARNTWGVSPSSQKMTFNALIDYKSCSFSLSL